MTIAYSASWAPAGFILMHSMAALRALSGYGAFEMKEEEEDRKEEVRGENNWKGRLKESTWKEKKREEDNCVYL